MTTKVQSIIAVDSDVGAGAATWWRLTAVDYKAFTDALDAIAWPMRLYPTKMEDTTALKRALDFDMKAGLGRKFQIIPLGTEGTYAVEETVVNGEEVTHRKLFKVLVKESGTLHFWDTNPDYDDVYTLMNRTEDGFNAWRGRLDGYDLGMWLSGKVVPHLMGLALRDRGGIYYVPPVSVPAYRQVADAISNCGGGRIYELPAMECDRAVDAILAAVQEEAMEAAARMEKDLEGDLGAVALKNRAGRCDKVLEKVSAYEGMLGKTLDDLRQKMETLQATIAAAILTAEAADAAEEQAA